MSESDIVPDRLSSGASPQVPVPGRADSERLLHGVEIDLESLDELDTTDQVPVYDRLHTALADALARTADTGASPQQGSQHGPPLGRPGA